MGSTAFEGHERPAIEEVKQGRLYCSWWSFSEKRIMMMRAINPTDMKCIYFVSIINPVIDIIPIHFTLTHFLICIQYCY